MTLAQAQDAVITGHPSITKIDYRFANIAPIEITDFTIRTAPANGAADAPTLRPLGLALLALLSVAIGILILRRLA